MLSEITAVFVGCRHDFHRLLRANTVVSGEGLRLLDEAGALVAQTGERMYEAELSRLRVELVRHPTPT